MPQYAEKHSVKKLNEFGKEEKTEYLCSPVCHAVKLKSDTRLVYNIPAFPEAAEGLPDIAAVFT